MSGFTGGCLCGAIRYEVKGEPVRIANCHCDDCRKATGASFATNVFIKEDELAILQGKPKQFHHKSDSGSTMTKEFCPDCGSQLFGYGSSSQGIKHVKVGTIDDARFVEPEIEVYVARALPYNTLCKDTEKFPEGRPR
jgi:hypothetical protein